MSRSPTLYLLLALPFTAAALTAGACSSSSSSPNVDEGDSGSGTPDVTTDQSLSDTSSFDSASDTSLPDTFVPYDSGPPHDAQAACAVTGVDGGDGGSADAGDGAVATDNLEHEPNDDVGNANTLVLNGPECGLISSATDVDFFKFTLPANGTTMQLTFDGNISLKFTVGTDAPVTVTPASFPTIPFHPGAEYTVEVHSFDDKPQAYAITITES